MSEVKLYRTARPVRDFLDDDGNGLPGAETSGTLLTYYALDAHAAAVTAGMPCEVAIAGEFKDHQGRRRLVEACNVEWVLATRPDIRVDSDGRLQYFCTDCQGWKGNHSRSCQKA